MRQGWCGGGVKGKSKKQWTNSVREGRAGGGAPWRKIGSLQPMENAHCSRFSSWTHAGIEEKGVEGKVADTSCYGLSVTPIPYPPALLRKEEKAESVGKE